MFEFGKRSKENIATCEVDLQKILNLAIKVTKVDFGVSEGHRPIKKQQAYFAIGRTVQVNKPTITNIDGVNKKGKHNKLPSEAFDIYIYTTQAKYKTDVAYNRVHLAYVAGVIDACAEILYNEGEITHLIRWGGNWDNDGIIDLDQSFDDLPHFELRTIK